MRKIRAVILILFCFLMLYITYDRDVVFCRLFTEEGISDEKYASSETNPTRFRKYIKHLLPKKEYTNLEVYKYMADLINNNKLIIKDNPVDFKSSVDSFERKYKKRKKLYNKISKYVTNHVFSKKDRKKYGVPAALIAALHFRENETDYDKGSFLVDPENGENAISDKLSKKERIKRFKDLEVKLFMVQKNRIKNVKLTRKSKDIVAMCAIALYHNGKYDVSTDTGNIKDTWKHSPYVFSGTSQYDSGKFVYDLETDRFIYISNKIDQQVGVLRTLDSVI